MHMISKKSGNISAFRAFLCGLVWTVMHHRNWLIVSCILQLYPQQSDLLVSSLSCRSACRLSSQFHLYSTLQLSACAQCNRPMTLTMTCLTLAQEKASIITLCHPTMLPKFAEQQSTEKDFRDAEMDTLTKSCSPTKVITANGEVQTHEEATVYVKELDIFLTMKVEWSV